MPTLHDLLYPLSGFVVGVIVGLTGVGGGSLMTPLLVMMFGIHPKTAVGTDLLYAAITKIFGTVMHHAGNTVDWKLVRHLAYGSLPATVVTLVFLSHAAQHGKDSGATINFVLGIVLLLTAASILARRYIVKWTAHHFDELNEKRTIVLTIISGAILGLLVSLSSAGAGAIGVTMLLVLYPRMPIVRIIGSDIAHAVPLTLVAGAGHWYLGDVDLNLLYQLLIGSIPGILIGSWLAPRTSEFGLRSGLAAVLTLVGLRLVHVY